MKKNHELFKFYKFIYDNFRIILLINILVFSIYFIIGSKLFNTYYKTEITIGSKSHFELISVFNFNEDQFALNKSYELSIKDLIFDNFLNNLKSMDTKEKLANKFNIKNDINIIVNHRKISSDAIIYSESQNKDIEKILLYATIIAEQKTINFLKIKKNENKKNSIINYHSIKSMTINKIYSMKNIITLFILNIILIFFAITIKEFKKLI